MEEMIPWSFVGVQNSRKLAHNAALREVTVRPNDPQEPQAGLSVVPSLARDRARTPQNVSQSAGVQFAFPRRSAWCSG